MPSLVPQTILDSVRSKSPQSTTERPNGRLCEAALPLMAARCWFVDLPPNHTNILMILNKFRYTTLEILFSIYFFGLVLCFHFNYMLQYIGPEYLVFIYTYI